RWRLGSVARRRLDRRSRTPGLPYTTLFRSSPRYTGKGELFLAATRGSGTEGEDITINALEVADIPAKLDKKRFAGRNLAIEVRRSEEHTSELQSRENLVCRLLLEKKSVKWP